MEVGSIEFCIERVSLSPEDDSEGLWFRWSVPSLSSLSISQEQAQVGTEESEEEKEGKEASPPQEQPKAIVYEGKWPVLERCSMSPGLKGVIENIPLTSVAIETLAQSEIILEAFTGDDAVDDGRSKHLGSFSVPLLSCLQNGCTTTSGSFLTPAALVDAGEQDSYGFETLDATVVIQLGDALEKFCKAGRFLQVQEAFLGDVPEKWSALVGGGYEGSCTLEVFGKTLVQADIVLKPPTPRETTDGSEASGEEEEHEDEGEKKLMIMLKPIGNKFATVFLEEGMVQDLCESGKDMEHSVTCTFPKPTVDPKQKGTPPPFHNIAKGFMRIDSLFQESVTKQDCRSILTVSVPVVQHDEPAVDSGRKEKDAKKSKNAKNAKADKQKEQESEPVEPPKPETVELQVSFTVIPALFSKPPTPKPVLRTPRDIIEARAPRRVRQLSGEDLLEQATSTIVEMVCDEIASVSEQENEDTVEKDTESSRRAKVFFQLTTSGKYQMIRDSLKQAISKYTTEHKTQLQGQGDVLYSSVYERVMNVLHAALNKKTRAILRDQEFVNPSSFPAEKVSKDLEYTLQQLLVRAEDAELSGSFDIAEQLYQQRVKDAEAAVFKPSDYDLLVNPSVWYDCGMFNLSRGEAFQAVAAECFRSAISIDDKHVQSLAAFGLLLAEADRDNEEQIEVFLTAASTLFQESQKDLKGDRLECFMTCIGVLRLLKSRIAAAENESWRQLQCFDQIQDKTEMDLFILTSAAKTCLQLKLPRLTQELLDNRAVLMDGYEFASSLVARENRTNTKLLTSWALLLSGNMNAAAELLEEATLDFEIHKRAEPFVFLGNYVFTQGSCEQVEAYERALDLAGYGCEEEEKEYGSVWTISAPEKEVRKMLLNMARIYVSVERFEDAQAVSMILCSRWPTEASWRYLGESHLGLGQFKEAINALSQANMIDRENPVTWGLLAVSCLHQSCTSKDAEEKDHMKRLGILATEQALDKELRDPALFYKLSVLLFDLGEFSISEKCTSVSTSIDPAESRFKLQLAKTCIYQKRFQKADDIISALQQDGFDAKQLSSLQLIMSKVSHYI